MVSGPDALRAHGVPAPFPRQIHLLVPPDRRMLAREFINIERSARLPDPVLDDGIPFAPPARATIDTARAEMDRDQLRRLLTLPVYHGLCTIDDLHAELASGNQRGSSAVRKMLRELGSMGDTYLHGVARELLRRVPLPAPSWNVTICDSQSRPIGAVEAWWDEVAFGWQFGAHGPDGPNPKLDHLGLTAAGVVLGRTERERLRADA